MAITKIEVHSIQRVAQTLDLRLILRRIDRLLGELRVEADRTEQLVAGRRLMAAGRRVVSDSSRRIGVRQFAEIANAVASIHYYPLMSADAAVLHVAGLDETARRLVAGEVLFVQQVLGQVLQEQVSCD